MASPKRKPKPKPKKEAPDREQSERFKETARKLEADKSGSLFERALRAIMPPKTPGKSRKNEGK